MAYTSQTLVDVDIIHETLEKSTKETDHIKFLEIGTYQGDTSREIKRWCDYHLKALEFWGIEAGRHPQFNVGDVLPLPFPEANMIYGDSAEVFHQIPYGLDVVLVDGCHCVNHVILDTIHYGDRVKPGGFMMFHDTAWHIQQTMRDPHGPDIPEFYNSVIKAHTIMRFPFKNWELFAEGFDKDAKFGGMTVYRKLE